MRTRESLNGRENMARRKVKNGEKSSSRRSLLFFVPYIFSRPFRLSLAPFIYPWVSEDGVRRPALLVLRQVTYPLEGTDQHEDQSKDILNSILKEELPDSDSEALIEEL